MCIRDRCNPMNLIPIIELPSGYEMRPMRSDEIGLWTDIQRDAETLFKIDSDLFEREFGDDPEAWKRRCFFLVNPAGVAQGTISAWYSRDFLGEDYGRIHW